MSILVRVYHVENVTRLQSVSFIRKLFINEGINESPLVCLFWHPFKNNKKKIFKPLAYLVTNIHLLKFQGIIFCTCIMALKKQYTGNINVAYDLPVLPMSQCVSQYSSKYLVFCSCECQFFMFATSPLLFYLILFDFLFCDASLTGLGNLYVNQNLNVLSTLFESSWKI